MQVSTVFKPHVEKILFASMSILAQRDGKFLPVIQLSAESVVFLLVCFTLMQLLSDSMLTLKVEDKPNKKSNT